MMLALRAASYYTRRLDDPKAVFLTQEAFAAQGDGVADDTAAFQRAIDRVQETTRRIVFVPEGRYRLTHTIHVWPGVRLIGYGPRGRPGAGPSTRRGTRTRATKNTWCSSPAEARRRGGPRRPRAGLQKPPDANPARYSAMSNIDIEIGAGNPGAWAVRAQVRAALLPGAHGFSYRLRPRGHPRCRQRRPRTCTSTAANTASGPRASPGWQFTMMDATFEGQREGGHPGPGSRAHADPAAFPERSPAIATEPGYRRDVGQRRPDRGHLRAGRRHRRRKQPAHRDQHRERRLPARAGVRVLPRERQEDGGPGRDL